MRRRTTLAVVAGGATAAVVGGAIARSCARGRQPGLPKPVTGIFPNGMAYLRLGTGPKTMVWIPGGPGNTLPTGGLALRMGESWSRPFVDQGYAVWWVTRKQNMPRGHSYGDMADDYGRLITDEFDGKVDVVLGMSTGGQIGFYLAARHPDRFGHIVIAAAGYEDNERAKAMLLPSARLLSEGKIGEAMALMLEDMFPSWPRAVVRVLGMVMGRSMYGRTHPYFAGDVIVEAEAELACDARDVLPLIPVPVLLVGGDRDPYFPKEVYEKTARLIPDCTLRLYEGRGHEGSVSDERFAQDVLDFVRQRPVPGLETGVERPTVRGEPVGTAAG
ncbi:MAG: alpha/beta fold hydrolase [Candidatus Limnocylindrales bacterium]